jgi:CpXC protein
MTPSPQTSIRCASCGQPFQAQVRTLVDVKADPQAKSLLMAGRLNSFQCPHCEHVNQLVAPLLYHDPDKSLLIAYIPMEVSMQSGKPEEKLVGDLLNDLTRSIPKEDFRSYMFNPKRALTMQGLMDQVMEADGITKEMLDAQRKRVDLIQSLLSAGSEDVAMKIINDNDSLIDLSFFQTLSLMAQRMLSEGRQDIAAGLVAVQEALLVYSTYGKEIAKQRSNQENVVREVAQAINDLGEQADRGDLIRLAVGYADEVEKLQALAGLVRAALDPQFFTEFTQVIGQAPSAEREKMQQVMTSLQEYTQMIDQQQQATIQETVQFLQLLLQSPEPDALIQENIEMIDNTFMSILSANIQESQRRGDQNAFNRLNALYEKVVSILQSNMSPELQYINQLLTASTEQEMRSMIQLTAGDFDRNTLLATVDAVEEVLQAQGQAAALQRLAVVRQALQSGV